MLKYTCVLLQSTWVCDTHGDYTEQKGTETVQVKQIVMKLIICKVVEVIREMSE